jgi:hypothetical protein
MTDMSPYVWYGLKATKYTHPKWFYMERNWRDHSSDVWDMYLARVHKEPPGYYLVHIRNDVWFLTSDESGSNAAHFATLKEAKKAAIAELALRRFS